MPVFDYAGLREDTRELLREFGQNVKLVRVRDNHYIDSEGEPIEFRVKQGEDLPDALSPLRVTDPQFNPPPTKTLVDDVTMVISNINLRELPGVKIRRGDQMGIMIGGGPRPEPDDKIITLTEDGVQRDQWRVDSVMEVSPSGISILFRLHLTKHAPRPDKEQEG